MRKALRELRSEVDRLRVTVGADEQQLFICGLAPDGRFACPDGEVRTEAELELLKEDRPELVIWQWSVMGTDGEEYPIALQK